MCEGTEHAVVAYPPVASQLGKYGGTNTHDRVTIRSDETPQDADDYARYFVESYASCEDIDLGQPALKFLASETAPTTDLDVPFETAYALLIRGVMATDEDRVSNESYTALYTVGRFVVQVQSSKNAFEFGADLVDGNAEVAAITLERLAEPE